MKIFQCEKLNIITIGFAIKLEMMIIREDLYPSLDDMDFNSKLTKYKDFTIINTLFKSKLGEEFMLIEDFWFWGYFSTKVEGKNRIIEFNEDKFYTAEFLKPTDENRKIITEFVKILKND